MAGEQIDAYLIFGDGTLPGGKQAPEISGESKDNTTNWGNMKDDEGDSPAEYWPSQIKSYSLGFALNSKLTEEKKDKKGDKVDTDPQVDDIKVTKQVDTASPSLLAALWYGACYDPVWILQRKVGIKTNSMDDYFWRIKLRDVYIAHLSWNGEADASMTETVDLRFTSMTVTYLPQKRTGELDKSGMTTSGRLDQSRHGDKNDTTGSDGGASDTQIQAVVNKMFQQLKLKNPTWRL